MWADPASDDLPAIQFPPPPSTLAGVDETMEWQVLGLGIKGNTKLGLLQALPFQAGSGRMLLAVLQVLTEPCP